MNAPAPALDLAPDSLGARDRPSALPFVLSVGITGLQREAIPEENLAALEARIRELLGVVAAEARRVHGEAASYFSDGAPVMRLVSPLAAGADQIAAEAALDLGFELQAVLPFDREHHRAELADDDARARFDRLLKRATCVLELLGGPDDPVEPYAMAGFAAVAHCDLLIAVWDHRARRNRGAAGEVARFAVDKAKPVIHVPVDPSAPIDLRWSAFEPSFVTEVDDPATIRPMTREELAGVFDRLLAPPADPREREFIRLFSGERRRLWRWRVEYPLLLAVAGVSPFRRRHWRTDQAAGETLAEWRHFREACDGAQAVTVPLGPLESWYEWADSLAQHFAQSFRSSHVFNFVLGAVAVLLGTINLVLPNWVAIYLEVTLFLVVLAILANIWAANRLDWHRRWLDYRQLAERLRPMRSLKMLAVATPNAPGTPAFPVPQRWIEWYTAAAWRAMGCPSGRIDAAGLRALSAAINENEIAPQVAYHHKASGQVAKLDRRLGKLGTGVFCLALLSSIVLITAFKVAPDWVWRNYNWFTILSAGLPAIGTAIVGIRVQGDTSASAARSEQTAVVLQQIGTRLKDEGSSLVRAADLVEQAAKAMLSDLDEWRLLNQQHDLSVG